MTTAVLSALPEEQEGLAAQLEGRRVVRHAGRDFHAGEWHGRPVVFALSRIGKVAAATTAAALIEQFKVRRIVFTGVAGGLHPDVRVGDTVIGTGFLQHDMDA
jgi:adenosylhomocysteine nucleosidase